MRAGPSTTLSSGESANRYTPAHNGRSDKADIAQNGILRRVFAATTYAGSGATAFGFGASAGFAGVVVAGVDDAATAGDAPDALSPDAASRRALERLRRCSGISVTSFTSRKTCADLEASCCPLLSVSDPSTIDKFSGLTVINVSDGCPETCVSLLRPGGQKFHESTRNPHKSTKNPPQEAQQE